MIDLIIANSSRGAEFNSQLINLPMSRYRVVYNGVDTGKFKPADNTGIRAELNIPRDAQVLGMFASFKQQKNHPFLFAAVKEISVKHPDLKLLLVGDMLYAGMHGSDAYYDRIQTQIKELGLQHNCIMPGNRNDIERVYPACDFTVLPSLFEGTPNVLLESMACGIPVIATDVSDNKKIVADGETGFIVELGNIPQLATAIDTLLSDKTKLQVFSKNSRKRMEDLFSTRKLAENTQAIYSSLLTQ
jgi:glycosyltransferase involved in cell wall biosynthesis